MAGQWQAGVAKVAITPDKPMVLAGYGHRTSGYTGKIHDVWAKALALQDGAGQRVVIITTDLCGYSRAGFESLRDKLGDRYRLGPDQFVLGFSHNHCAPITTEDLEDYYDIDDEQRARTREYSEWLEGALVDVVGQALANLQPATLSRGVGECTFAVNRRNNKEAEVPGKRERGEPLAGPVDHSVPVLAVKDEAGKLLAALFGYACHNTTLSFEQLCGDYAGWAQIGVEAAHPGTTGLFFMGCGADANPIPRREMKLAEQYGRMLAEAVNRVLAGPMEPVAAELKTAFAEVTLEYERVVSREDLTTAATKSSDVRQRWGKRLLAALDGGRVFQQTYPYPVQVMRLGDLLWINLGAEAVVDYAFRFRREYGPHTWIGGYTDVQVSYIPSRRVWDEGGYEAAYLYEYGHPAERWQGDIEDRICVTVAKLVAQVQAE